MHSAAKKVEKHVDLCFYHVSNLIASFGLQLFLSCSGKRVAKSGRNYGSLKLQSGLVFSVHCPATVRDHPRFASPVAPPVSAPRLSDPPSSVINKNPSSSASRSTQDIDAAHTECATRLGVSSESRTAGAGAKVSFVRMDT